MNLSGTLRKDRTSFSLSAGGAALYDSAYIFAAVPGRSVSAPVRRPSDRMNFNLRVDHALNKAHTLRGSFQQNDNDLRNLGVGSYDLEDRAFARNSSDSILRLSESGPLARLVVRRVAAAGPRAAATTTSRASRRRPSACSTPSRPAAPSRRRPAQHRHRIRDRHRLREARALAADGHAARRRHLSQRQPHQLSWHLHVLEPRRLQRRAAGDLHAPLGKPAGRVLAVAGGVLPPGRLARAEEPDASTRACARSSRRMSSDHWNLAPRGGVTWSPFKNGKTTVRAGGGLFYEWLDADTFEQTLRVDGTRQQDLVIVNPGYPDPFAGGDGTAGAAAEPVTARGRTRHAEARAGPGRRDAADLADLRREHELQPHERLGPVPRPQRQRAARTASGRTRPSATSPRWSRPRSSASIRSTSASTSTCRSGGRSCSPTTRSTGS